MPAWNSSGFECIDFGGALDSLCKAAFVKPAIMTRATEIVRRDSGLSVGGLEVWSVFDSRSRVVVAEPERIMTTTTVNRSRNVGTITAACRK